MGVAECLPAKDADIPSSEGKGIANAELGMAMSGGGYGGKTSQVSFGKTGDAGRVKNTFDDATEGIRRKQGHKHRPR